jgi:hypothetical protein
MKVTARVVDEFLTALAGRTAQAMVRDQKSLEQFQQQIFMNIHNSLRMQGLITSVGDQINETDLIDTMLLERRANEMGMVVSDAAINEFLNQISQQQLTGDDLQSISKEMQLSPNRLFDGLRTKLKALRVRQMFGYGLANPPPAQRWEYYLRLNRRARAEIVPVTVASMVDEVRDPDKETIRKFFDEHKETPRRPGTPEPGFKQPHQVALAYLKADYEQFLDEEAVTEQEIKDHYEKFKDTRYLFTEPVETTPPADEEKPEEEKPEEEKPASDDKSENESPKKEESKESSSEDKKPADDPKSDESSCGDGQEQEQQKPADTSADKPAETKPAEAPASGSDKAADTGADQAQPEAEKSEEPKEKSLLEIASELALPRSVRDGPRPKHNPLWRVEKDIRRELAGQKAAQKIADVFRQIKPILDQYYENYGAWKSDNAGLPKEAQKPQPPSPDFAALAEKHGLTAHETGLQSLYEIATETDVGKAIAEVGQGLQRPNYVEAALQTPLLYKAATVQDAAGNQYLYWKVDNVEEHVPTLDEEGIREQVVETWKEIQARDLAKKKAEDLAKEAREGKSSLSEAIADEKGLEVITTQPFTWMTAGNPFLGPSEPRLTSVPGVESPGNEFMSAVFGLEEGEVAVTHNVPQDAYYVVRVTSLEPSLKVLQETFAIESPRQNQNYFALAQEENMEVSRHWIESVREEAGLHWTRPAAELAMRTQR